jgi:rRNA processing protein Krr1/Pno1
MSLELENNFVDLVTNGDDYQVVNSNLIDNLGAVVASTSSGSLGDTNTNTSSSSSNGEDLNNYDSVFPSLPTTGTNITISNAWNNTEYKSSSKRNLTTTKVLHVPAEERIKSFGTTEPINRKCNEIANRLGVKVEISCSKDSSLHIVISGAEDKVIEARALIVKEIQEKIEKKINVPKEQHKYLIGKAGSVLKELQEKFCIRIQVPDLDSLLDEISIFGPKDGIEQAIHEIQQICDEQAKSDMVRLSIPKIIHPWIRGCKNEISDDIALRSGAKVNIPPAHIEKDEIIVSGDREKVDLAVQEIRQIAKEKSKLNITKLAIQITKSQHKLIIGKSGASVHEIFRDFDVYVQVPKLDSPSETIFLFGEEAKLGAALSQVCAKANSVVSIQIDVPSWLHRHMIGEKGSNIAKITADFQHTHVKFEQDNKITLDGPPDEVEKVRERLQNITTGLKQIMICEELTVDPKYYSQLVGKKYDNILRLNKEHGVVIRVPSENSANNVVRIEGAPNCVAKAKEEFLELLKKLENERSKDVIIEQKYHSNLIGKNGKNLNEIRAKFNNIQIQIPSQAEKSDIITIRGNKLDVEKCYKHLSQLTKDMQESGYSEEIQIFKELHKIIIGKGGVFIKKIRDETQVRIDVPAENSDSNAIVIVGKQENVFKARLMLEAKIKELVNIKEDSVEIPHALHTYLIGKGGASIKQIRKDCGGVIINFPPETNPSDNKITIKGPLEEIKKAKAELLKLAELKEDFCHSEEVIAKSEFHRFLVGHKGNNVNSLRDKYAVRVLFPSSNSAQNNASNEAGVPLSDIITILGKPENVKAVRQILEASIKNLEETITAEVNVDAKWHKNFTAYRAKLINKISEDNCNVRISFPKVVNSNVVTLKGPKEAVDSARKQILENVYEFENQITLEVEVPQKYHAVIIGKKGAYSQQMSDEFKVEIKFPAKGSGSSSNYHNNHHHVNGVEQTNGDHVANDENGVQSASPIPTKSDIIEIKGLKEDCEKAKAAILALVPISEEFSFPKHFHKELISNKAAILNAINDNYNVQVNVPKKDDDSDFLTLIGSADNLEEAKKALKKTLHELEAQNYSAEITNINAELIPQLRGRKGAEATKLEKQFNVRVEFSKIGEPDRVVIRGFEPQVIECKAFIEKKISADESKLSEEIQIDNKVHSRLIGHRYSAIDKIKEKFKVDIKFPDRESDVVLVKGDTQESIDDACDHLKNLEEEYLQDVVDREAYTHPSRQSTGNEAHSNGNAKGFVVRGAPWEQQQQQQQSRGGNNNNKQASLPDEPVPDTSNMEDFPTMTAAVNGTDTQKPTWGPSRK